MLDIDEDRCTGCGACLQKCPKQCIFWKEREFGFRYPEIDKNLCIGCGLCTEVCPIGKNLKLPDKQKIFAAVHKDRKVLKCSTSGGVFSALACYVLAQEGIVYGCCMDSSLKTVHTRVDTIGGVARLRGSKYIQSDVKNTFSQAEADLKEGKRVLYTGTPCQIAGLYRYLGKHYERLVTMDIVCHGVGSQAYFDKYLDYARHRYGEIKEIRFRSKEYNGWSCGNGVVVGGNGDIKKLNYYNNYYYYYYLMGGICRQSCYVCQYANTLRQADFTAGDFWGVESYELGIDTESGCSLLLVNNSRSWEILDGISDLNMVEVTQKQAVGQNEQLKHPLKKTTIRGELMGQFETLDAEGIHKLFVKNNIKEISFGLLKSLVPYRVKLMVRRRKSLKN